MSYKTLALKWRPQTFDDLTGQETIAKILKNAVLHQKTAHAYIFSGPKGVGKTTTARILAKALNCTERKDANPCGICASCKSITDGSSIDVHEIDGASNNRVDDIRDLRDSIKYSPATSRYRIYIIDEAHMLTTAAYNAFLKTLEEPPTHAIFVLATTEPKRIIPTVLSRCQHLPFRRIPTSMVVQRLKYIAQKENVAITDSAIKMIARFADGGMRDALTIMDQLSSFCDSISEDDVSALLGMTDTATLADLTEAVLVGDRLRIIKTISELSDAGVNLKQLSKDMITFLRNLMIVKIAGDTNNIIDLSDAEIDAISRLTSIASQEQIALVFNEYIKGETFISNAFFPRVVLEMLLIRLSLMSKFNTIDKAFSIIEKLTSDKTNLSDDLDYNNSSSVISKTQQLLQSVNPTVSVVKNDTEGNNNIETASYTSKSNLNKDGHLTMSLSDAWQQTIKCIEEDNQPLYFKLKDASVSYETDRVILSFIGGTAIHADSVKENIFPIKTKLENFYGKPIEIKINEAKTEKLTKKERVDLALKNPIVSDALKIFEAKIIDVTLFDKGDNDVKKDA